MKRTRLYLAIFSIVLSTSWVFAGGMYAQDANRIAVVVRHSDEKVQMACVEFTETEISALELMQRSGLDMEIDLQGLGAIVCRLEQTGCPSDDCWCQCQGGECIYWSYWQKMGDEWQYSQIGASQRIVRDGDVEGWSWGPGAVDAAVAPPKLTFEQVCTSPSKQVSESATAASVAMVDSSIVPRFGEQKTKKQIETSVDPQPKVTRVGADVEARDQRAARPASEFQNAEINTNRSSSSLFAYAFFGLIVVGLVGLLFSSVKRRGK